MHESMIKECIETCWKCRTECQKTFYHYCLNQGGKHLEHQHVKLMIDCMQICQTAADFMTRKSKYHQDVCGACAAVCEACASSCENINDEKMHQCAAICKECAEQCKSMANG